MEQNLLRPKLTILMKQCFAEIVFVITLQSVAAATTVSEMRTTAGATTLYSVKHVVMKSIPAVTAVDG